MITFNYTAKNKDGELIRGQVEAQSESAAAKVLTGRALFPISISTKQDAGFSLLNRVGLKDKVMFTRQLAATLGAGLPITQALRTISAQTNKKSLQAIISKVVTDVEGGTPLSVSFSHFPQAFNRIDVALIESGEASGTLDKVLKRLADSTEKDYEVMKKVRSALIYPAFILVVVGLVLALMAIYVMPQMEGLYTAFNSKLPVLTLAMIGLSHFLSSYGVLVIIAIVALVLGIRYYIKTPVGKGIWDRLILSLPIIAPFLRNVYASRFSRTMGSLVGSGVSLLDSISITSYAVGNDVISDILSDASKDVKGGKTLSSSIAKSKEFPAVVSQLVAVGEQTGEMDSMFTSLADYFDNEVDNYVKSITSILEPAIIVVMGGLVCLILVSVMLPIYSIGKIF